MRWKTNVDKKWIYWEFILEPESVADGHTLWSYENHFEARVSYHF